jgi:type IV secretory pathway VirB2 component (pilin)
VNQRRRFQTHNVIRRIERAAVIAAAFAVSSASAWALGGGRLAKTQALNGLATEFSGPLAYSVSLIAIVASAVNWYRHHHGMGVLAQGGLGALFVAGVAHGGSSLLA